MSESEVDQFTNSEFQKWFRSYFVENPSDPNEVAWSLSYGAAISVTRCKKYIINGYRFSTVEANAGAASSGNLSEAVAGERSQLGSTPHPLVFVSFLLHLIQTLPPSAATLTFGQVRTQFLRGSDSRSFLRRALKLSGRQPRAQHQAVPVVPSTFSSVLMASMEKRKKLFKVTREYLS
ncbi:hypothetical protein K1719_025760 [Acacia pycnantha]|nr:hypothetical protein K1719_025760 [Acacia pycnantha]